MRLLSKTVAEFDLKRENDELIGTNIRLRQLWQNITQKLNTVRETYEPEKLKKLKDFDDFCKEILAKKSKLLEELAGIETQITQKKELYYGLIAKRDELLEKEYQISEANKKLKLRETFLEELEEKQGEKQL